MQFEEEKSLVPDRLTLNVFKLFPAFQVWILIPYRSSIAHVFLILQIQVLKVLVNLSANPTMTEHLLNAQVRLLFFVLLSESLV